MGASMYSRMQEMNSQRLKREAERRERPKVEARERVRRCECGASLRHPNDPCCERCAFLDGVLLAALHPSTGTPISGNPKGSYEDIVDTLRDFPEGATTAQLSMITGRDVKNLGHPMQRLCKRGRVVAGWTEEANEDHIANGSNTVVRLWRLDTPAAYEAPDD
jgi:hypothetical protein